MKKFTHFTIFTLMILSIMLIKGAFATSKVYEEGNFESSSIDLNKLMNEYLNKEYFSSSLVESSNNHIYTFELENILFDPYKSLSELTSNFSSLSASVVEIAITPTSLNFGNIKVGQTANGIIQFHNNSGKDVEVSVVSNNSNVHLNPSTFLISSGVYVSVSISMDVLSEGNNSAQITFNTSNQNYPILYANISAFGYFPPKISVSPNTFDLTLEHGQTASEELSIANSGSGQLNYYISFQKNHTPSTPPGKIGLYAGSPDSKVSSKNIKILTSEDSNQSIESSSKATGDIINTYSLSGVSLPTGTVWVNGLLYILDYSSSCLRYYNPATYTTHFVASIFSYPYGITWDGTYLWIGNSSGRFYSYNLNGTSAGSSFQGPISSYSGINFNGGVFYISPLWQSGVYKVNYSGTILWSATLPGGITGGQIVYVNDHTDGNIWVLRETGGGTIFQIKNDFTSILKTINCGFGESVYALTHDGSNLSSAISSQVRIFDDGIKEVSWLNSQTLFGTIEPGMVFKVPVDIDATDLSVGDYTAYVVVRSNDQLNPEIAVPVNLTVTGQPQISVTQNALDFGNSLVDAISSRTVSINNTGGDILELTSFSSSLPQFSYSIPATTINPGESTNLTIYFQPTSPQNFNGLLTFATNDPANPTYTISAQGNGVTATVKFNVVDGFSGQPIPNANVIFNGVNLGEGNYETAGYSAGIYSYSVSLSGYTTVNGNVTVDQFEEVVSVSLNLVPSTLIMTNGTIVTNCNTMFYDPGYTGNYSNNQDMTLTVSPSSPGSNVRIEFQSFYIESGWDYFYIYDGLTTSAPLLGTFSGNSLPPTFTATNADGALTFRFYTDGSVVYSGWQAYLSCVTGPVSLPALDFTVLDAVSFNAIPGAVISIDGLGSGTTDISGEYSFGVVNNGTYTYSVIKNGYLEGTGVINYPGTFDATVSLNRWPSVSFLITDQTGNPVSNANVNLGTYNQQTNGSGLVIFNQIVPLKNYLWTVTKTGYLTISGEQYVGDDNLNLSYQIQSNMVDLTLFILDASTDNPLKDAVFVVDGQRYVTGADGRLIFNNIPKGYYAVTASRHAYYDFSETIAVNSSEALIKLNKIPSVSLPFSESFNSEIPSNFSVYDLVVSGYQKVWDYSSSTSSGGVFGELNANWRSGVSTVRLLLPPINTLNQSIINLSFKQFFDDWGGGMKVLVETSTDGNIWTPTGWEINSGSGNYGPGTISLPITSNTNSANTYIAFTLTGNLFQFDNWYVDDIQVTYSGGLYNSSILVYDNETSNVISGAQVSVSGYGSLLTDNSGVAYFTGLVNGTYGYLVTKDGYNNKSGSLTINNNNSSSFVGLAPTKTYTLTLYAYDQSSSISIQGALISVEGLGAAETDSDGKAQWTNVPVGNYNITISKTGYYDYTGVTNVSGTTVDHYPLDQKFFKANFTVVDGNSIPIQNALITVNGVSGITTNEAGVAVVQNLESNFYTFTIQKSGFELYSNIFSISGSDEDVYVQLTVNPPALYNVLFHITELDGSPINNATVLLTGFGPVNSDINGDVLFTDIPVGTALTYKVSMTDYSDSEGNIGLISEDKELSIVLKPIITETYQVTFHVTNAAGVALAGALVHLDGFVNNTTDASGNVTFIDVPFSNQLSYQVTLATYKAVDGFVNVHGDVTTAVTMALAASTTYSVSFFVTNSSSNPVNEATVYLAGYGSLTTNSSGSAVFTQVAPQNGISYTVSKSPYANVTGSLNVVNTNIGQNITINTNVYRALFTVKDQFNNPYEGVEVRVNGISSYTNYYGNAILGGLAPGMYSYMISSQNTTNLNGSFTVASADALVPITIIRPAYPVTFTILDEFGVVVPDAAVQLSGYVQKTTNSSGQVLYTEVVAANDIPFTVSKAGYTNSEGLVSVTNVAVEKNITLVLKRHSVQFSITAGSESITDAIVTFNGQTNQSGNYLFTEILPGSSYNYSVSRTGYLTKTGTASVSDYTIVSVNLDLETFPVTFNVSASRKKSDQKAITANILIGGVTDTLTIGATGQVSKNLPKGFYNFKIWSTGYQTYYGSFEIAGSAVTVTVNLQVPTGFDNVTLSSIKAFPNPFTNQITLNNTSKVKQVIVTNLIGQRLLFKDYKNEQTIQIETSEFISGVYLIKIIGNDDTHHVIRMVKK
ncbi:MAG: choice-of-anchor D domain-containing protein [Tenuifilaceae bacterium]